MWVQLLLLSSEEAAHTDVHVLPFLFQSEKRSPQNSRKNRGVKNVTCSKDDTGKGYTIHNLSMAYGNRDFCVMHQHVRKFDDCCKDVEEPMRSDEKMGMKDERYHVKSSAFTTRDMVLAGRGPLIFRRGG